ncbi:MAG: ATPase family associated with various cellular activities (AAA) [Candidatus Cloacimonetes bacterium ADurb.Bin088]|jgi:MoxR-like ATPase|nr:MAG: ATPase family associated with various cellular activities (AAA) [Candidatus Cloacimonetes bacterium ADurb.Bin088]
MNSETMIQQITELKTAKEELLKQIRKTIIGQDKVVEQVLIGLFANGHMLIEGVPGLAKTLLISTIAKALNLSFGRIQFTPDLMPSDITGSDILVTGSVTGEREFKYIKGPIFANIILADEINRTPPKTQAALLQAMQEYQVSSGNTTRPLDLPFIVMATQNPIEQEGTYPLPEAQLDRFMLYIGIDYPSYEEELAIVQSTTGAQLEEPQALLSAETIIQFQNAIRNMPLSNHVLEYAVKLARSTRPGDPGSKAELRKLINWGAGPRASQYLVLAAKARAALDGRLTPAEEDVRAVAVPVLSHRILKSFAAEAEGIKVGEIIKQLLE